MTNPANAVVDRAMRAAFRAWQDDMVGRGQTSALNAKFDDVAPRDRRLIELQCRAAIASLKEGNVKLSSDPVAVVETYRIVERFIDAALKP